MLLVIDVGNSHTVMGIYKGKQLVTDWRIRTERNTTADEFHVLVSGLFKTSAIAFSEIGHTIISCVVPPMVSILNAFCKRYLGHAPRWVDARTMTSMPILLRNPAEVGADRIVNAVGAYNKYGQSMIIIDFGTATTFDVVSQKGEYLGGAITPGIRIAAEALFMKASKLPRVELAEVPATAIGDDTISSIQSGIIFGYAALVDGMVARMQKELDTTPRIIATGGLATLMKDVSNTIEVVDEQLTLEGLRLLHEEMETEAR